MSLLRGACGLVLLGFLVCSAALRYDLASQLAMAESLNDLDSRAKSLAATGNRPSGRGHNGTEVKQGRAEGKHVLAFFFPQFHEFRENSDAWGEGFTDFTNVEKVQENPIGMPIIRPAESRGFYDLLSPHQRQFQGELASQYGISGFVYMTYWFSDHPVMDRPLQLMLSDGLPDIKFCLMWANERWTRKWDGLSGPNVILEQTYSRDHWKAHWLWLVKFFKHKNYILVDGKPMLILYRVWEVPNLQDLLQLWRKLAVDAGFRGLHIVQMNGVEWSKGALQPTTEADAVLEYYPNMYNGPQKPTNVVLTSPKMHKTHYFGAHCSWDNFPRHITDGKSNYQIMHPSVYKYVLRQNLARTQPGGFVFVNAWNEWGEGAAIEPSLQWRRRWLVATKEAVEEERSGQASVLGKDGFARSVPVPPAGVPKAGGADDAVCIVVRTYKGHATGQYNLYQLLASLHGLKFENWRAYVAATDSQPFPELKQIVASFSDKRMEVDTLKHKDLPEFTWKSASFQATDRLIASHCLSGEFRWLLVTNGDNWYTPDALDYLPPDQDMVLMNFYSRYTLINDVVLTNATGGGKPTEDCCMRFNRQACTTAAPAVGLMDLGGAIFNARRFAQEKRAFMQYDNACSHSCHDAALANDLYLSGWSYTRHPVDVCALYHNSNPKSCAMIGGVYWDSLDYYKARCYELAALPLPLDNISFHSFVQSDIACVCSRRNADPESSS